MQLFNWKTCDNLEIRDTRLMIVGRVDQAGARMAAIWMNYSSGQELFNAQDNFQIGVLQIGDRLDLSTVQAYLEGDARLPGGYVVYLERQLYERYYHFVADLLKVAFILAVLALGVVCFGAYNTTSLTLMERRRDIAILQTMGFTSRVVRRFLLGRTLLQTRAAFLPAGGTRRAMTAVLVPVPTHPDRRRIERDLVKLDSDATTREEKGRRVDARHRRATQALLDREEELVAGYPEVAYAGLVTVSAPSLELLDEHGEIVEQLAREHGMDIRVLDARQDVAWAAALPVGLAPSTLLAS